MSDRKTETSPEQTDSTRLEQIARVMLSYGVEFIVIGGQAEYLMGSPRVTYDVDLCYPKRRDNLERLAKALKQLNAKLRGVPEGIPFLLDAHTLEMGANFTFDTSVVALDILAWVEPLGDFDSVAKNARSYQFGDMTLRAIGLDDLIRVKRHINRPKDRDSLFQLLAIKRILAEHGTDDPSRVIG